MAAMTTNLSNCALDTDVLLHGRHFVRLVLILGVHWMVMVLSLLFSIRLDC